MGLGDRFRLGPSVPIQAYSCPTRRGPFASIQVHPGLSCRPHTVMHRRIDLSPRKGSILIWTYIRLCISQPANQGLFTCSIFEWQYPYISEQAWPCGPDELS